MKEIPYLNRITFEFSQEGNTLGSTQDEEELQIIIEAPVGSIMTEGGFIVLKSTTGWSINGREDLVEVFNFVEQISRAPTKITRT